MPLEQTVYIVNNSGKIISSGKQLLSIFKEAKASYQEKKAQIKGERTLQRSQTFAPRSSVAPHRLEDYYEEEDEDDYRGNSRSQPRKLREYEDIHQKPRRRSYDAASDAGSRRSHRHSTKHHGSSSRSIKGPPPTTTALTAKNLKAASEASSTKPSNTIPKSYRSPYAETLPLDQSRMDLTQIGSRSMAPAQSAALLPRSHSEADFQRLKKYKEIDLNLAYGEIPPDLESRIDLDPTREKEAKALSAKNLVKQIEGLLDEANCVQHTAGAMIKHLQEKPEAAAAVAFSLAELSKLVAKLSPAVLGLLQGGSPAVFGLLASPQFLIGTGLAVGVTVVMFGGWKMIKQVKEARAAKEALAWEASPQASQARPVLQRAHSLHSSQSAGYDEALVVEEELSVIESWRRGIEPFRDDESADIELITPEADRATRADERERRDEDIFDTRSHRSAARTHRTDRTHKTHKTERTHRTEKTERTHKTDKTERTHKTDKTERTYRTAKTQRAVDDEALETKSHRSTRTHRTEHNERRAVDDEALETKSHRSTRTHRTEHSERSARTDEMHDLIVEDNFDIASQRSARTHRTSKTTLTSKTSKTNKTNKTERMHKTYKSKLGAEVPRSSKESVIDIPIGAASEMGHVTSKGKGRAMLAIEDGSAQRARDDLDLVMRPRVQRRESDLLKALFKGKKDKSRSELVLV
ncbi:hypothetical protein VHEMI00321 [[Torrubiella] hemipterigena]|uniref:Uncharacterized protein n=1 Tax=[Torrubiella] hemipterigena TaxID=1531966 RepID=A0A0A1SQ50_9HYPO|nr:hypothetical protein VHEMI00321 [[Torrubiella] hemipterigena]